MTARARELTKRARDAEPGGPQSTSVPANTIRAFIDALGRLGYPTESLLANAGVRRSDLADPDARISCAVLPEILGAAMREKPMKNLAARLAAETQIGAFPLVDYLAVTSETAGAALKQLTRYLRLTEAPYTLDPKWHENPIRVVFDRPLNAFSVEFGIVLTVRHLRKEVEGLFNVLSVNFFHAPDDTSEIERLVGCSIYPNSSWNGFQLTRGSWGMPMRRRDHALCGVLEQHAADIAAKIPETNALARDVARVLASRMAEGDVQIETVARVLGTSTRSLQRRLAEAGISYQEMLDNTRRDAAGGYLSDPRLSIGDVAYLLGYSEPAAFHRAFKRWNGMTPQAFRNRHKEKSRSFVP
jgi:AraC-like DNA-binding protein